MDRSTIAIIDAENQEANIWTDSFNRISPEIKCRHFTGGYTHIQQIKTFGPDFIFCNLSLPHTSGLHYLAVAKNSSGLSGIKFYLYSNYISDEAAKMAKVLGASGCIERSEDLNKFQRHLRAILSQGLIPNFSVIK